MKQRSERILIVDDEPQVGRLILEELSEQGFVCRVAHDADLARSFIHSHRPDVLITDIQMPQTSGLELLAYARKHAPQCKVILTTGNTKREYVAQALLLGAYDYIEKPFRPGELVEVVSQAVNGGADSSILSDRAAAAMELSSQARQASLDSVRALVRAVEAKDPYTRRHCQQVAHYAVHLASDMGLPEATVESIRVASLLHDIGKIGVPDRILTKIGPLTDEEFEHMRRHSALGADILANITMLGQEAQLIRHHHERWDGKGYPDGLTGEETPLASRIIQVSDCIDAMLMKRTYKEGYPVEKMIGELIRCAETQFDPKIAAAAIEWCRSNPDKLILQDRELAAMSMTP